MLAFADKVFRRLFVDMVDGYLGLGFRVQGLGFRV